MREIIMPTLVGMAAEGLPYTGFLYAGLMIDAKGAPRVVEFNCRMGDPETQPIMMRLKSDLVDLVEAAVAGKLDKVEAEWDRRFALGVVMAAAGYPDSPRKGDAIHGLPATSAEDAHVFHAGTTEDGEIRTSGGRVLCVTALGDNVRAPRSAPTSRWTRSTSTACSAAATSATGPSAARANPMPHLRIEYSTNIAGRFDPALLVQAPPTCWWPAASSARPMPSRCA
jgi:phosphoribosylamine-glycine ligase